jgi:hypothetical protein
LYQPSEFEPIFNGKDLSGWVVKSTTKDSAKNYWRVEESCLVANSMGDSLHDYIWLQYDQPLQDFQLKFEFLPFRENTGNSGVQFRSRYDENEEWLNGPQIDIHPPQPWRTGMIWDETRGYQRWIYPDLPKGQWVNPSMAIANPPFFYAGDPVEWNKMEVIVRGQEAEAWLNGFQVTDFNGAGILDDSLHTSRNVGTEGYLLFQIHVKDQLHIRFRNIELKKLTAIE